MTWQDQLLRIYPYYRKSIEAPLDERHEETLVIDGGSQSLHDLYGVYEANHPEEGTFGSFVAEGSIPQGVVMIGYGPRQLLFDRDGALGGPKGAFWTCQDMAIDSDTKQIATSLEELLANARPRAGFEA